MRRSWTPYALAVCCSLTALVCARGSAQRHSFGTSPPTAPLRAPGPIAPVSSGMGAIQFIQVNYGVPAPQALTRQLRAEDDRTRAAALSAIGAPGQYLQRGHIVAPRSIQLELVPLDNGDDLQALLTAELDQHIVTAVLVQEDGNWRRVATLFYATSFDDPRTSPSTFVRTARSLVQRDRYRAVFHAASVTPNGDYIENEASVRVINSKAVVTLSYANASRDCGQPGSGNCTLINRWVQPDPGDAKRIVMVTATGRASSREMAVMGSARDFQLAHARNFSCQPFLYSDATSKFEPTAIAAPCRMR